MLHYLVALLLVIVGCVPDTGPLFHANPPDDSSGDSSVATTGTQGGQGGAAGGDLSSGGSEPVSSVSSGGSGAATGNGGAGGATSSSSGSGGNGGSGGDPCQAQCISGDWCGTLPAECNGQPIVCDGCPAPEMCGDNGHPNKCGMKCLSQYEQNCSAFGLPSAWGVQNGCQWPYKIQGGQFIVRQASIAGCQYVENYVCCPP